MDDKLRMGTAGLGDGEKEKHYSAVTINITLFLLGAFPFSTQPVIRGRRLHCMFNRPVSDVRGKVGCWEV